MTAPAVHATARVRRRAWPVAGLLVTAGLAGCLGEPEIQDRWTRLDILSSNLAGGERYAAGDSVPVRVRAAVTWRSILTGELVVELRASSTMGAGDVALDAEADRLDVAHDVDALLRASVTAGRATRPVTGWDHLIQEMDLAFTGRVPAGADSAGGAPIGLFVVVYLGEGDEIQLEDGSDSLVVTPFSSDEMEILPMGIELGIAP